MNDMNRTAIIGSAAATLAVLLAGGGRAAPFAMPELKEPMIPSRTFCISDYGAKAGGLDCTKAFARAMSACEFAGGGHVVVPPGRWTVGPIRLVSNCDLYLSEGAVVEFTDNPADYLPPVKTTWEGVECMGYSPLVYAYAVTNVSITGSGTLAPRMDLWRRWFDRGAGARVAMENLYGWCSTNAPVASRDVTAIPDNRMRPQLIQMNRSANVLLDGFRIRESPFWTIHLYLCENCIVRNVDSVAHGTNSDGVDIDMTRNVLIENCRFDQGDDGIVLKAGRNADGWRLNRPTENVVVTNCTFAFAHTLLGIGSELSGGIRNIWMADCRIGSTYNMIYIKTNRRRGGFVENVWVDRVICDGDVRSAVVGIDMNVLYQWAVLPDYELRYTPIRNINLSNVTAKSADWAVDLRGDVHQPPEGIRIGNLDVGSFRSGEKRVENCRNVVVDTKRGNGGH